MQNYKSLFFIISFFFLKGSLVVADEGDRQLTVGSKIFTENILLAEMLSLLLEEKYNFKITRKFNMGGTKLVFDSLKNGHIDIYPEYTGTGYTMLLKREGETNPKKTYRIVKTEFLKKFQLIWSLPLGFENTYALAVQEKDSRFKKINSISQLKGRISSFRLGMGHEFVERKDGFNNFSKKYHLHFSKDQVVTMNPALMYSALNNQEVDMIMAYSTDGRIQAFKLKTLKDDKSFFPSYEAAYLTRQDIFEKWPEVQKAFAHLENSIAEKEMISLNNQVDQLDYGITQTARNFLVTEKLLVDNGHKLQAVSLFNYYLSKKRYFFKILVEHLILVFVSLFFALLFSIPMGIWAVRNSKVEKVVFSIVNTLQTVPSIALLGLLIPFLGIGFAPAVTALFLYSLLPLIRNTFEGIRNVEGSYIEASAGIGLTAWQILVFVQMPLALPVILAGVRTATVIVVGMATLAAYIGAGGLGDPIFRGIATLDSRLIFLGAVPACLLAVILDVGIGFLEKLVISKGLKLEQNIDHIELQ
ncbi:MAG: ABC transporter permease subunit [Bdellovibrionales bacterium]|nr:ABC transporter permease subunit [Bdellovibrionales bacterium]